MKANPLIQAPHVPKRVSVQDPDQNTSFEQLVALPTQQSVHNRWFLNGGNSSTLQLLDSLLDSRA